MCTMCMALCCILYRCYWFLKILYSSDFKTKFGGKHMNVDLIAGEIDSALHLESSLKILAYLQNLSAKASPVDTTPAPISDITNKRLSRATTTLRRTSTYSTKYVIYPSV